MGTAFLYNFLRFLVIAFELVILGRVLLSYVEPRGQSAIGQFLIALTEPVLAPVRKMLPRGGMFDWSPLIVILVLGVVARAIPAG